jgi:two-component system, LuxR family, response regulator FixJ
MTSATPTKPVVHVIDDDEAVRDSLAFLLRSAELSVATYENAVAFLQSHPPQGPACIVTDVRMPEIGGIELLRRLRERNVTTPVIVITGHGDVPLAVEAMKLGAADFLEKPFSDESLLGAVHSALAVDEGKSKRGTELAAINEKIASLSNRERQVLEGLVSGHPNKSIAYDLQISPRTVEIYRANLMTKMNASSLSELVRMALLAGVLDRAGASPVEQPPTK